MERNELKTPSDWRFKGKMRARIQDTQTASRTRRTMMKKKRLIFVNWVNLILWLRCAALCCADVVVKFFCSCCCCSTPQFIASLFRYNVFIFVCLCHLRGRLCDVRWSHRIGLDWFGSRSSSLIVELTNSNGKLNKFMISLISFRCVLFVWKNWSRMLVTGV